jgi:hypothetical protein
MKPKISGISKLVLQKSFFSMQKMCMYDYNPTLSLDAQCNCMVFFFLGGGGGGESYDQGANIKKK